MCWVNKKSLVKWKISHFRGHNMIPSQEIYQTITIDLLKFDPPKMGPI